MQRGVLMLNKYRLEKSEEAPVAYRGAPLDSERAKRPPLPEPPYKPFEKAMPPEVPYEPYAKKPGTPQAPEIPYIPYEKPAVSEAPYKPYPKKPGAEIPYEPYKGI
jgi:hypothetical protein